MSDERRWVLLCECWDMAELQTLRASLEAHGLPVQVQGLHTHGVLGSIQSAAMKPRVLVPQAGLERARELLSEIMPLEDEGDDEERGIESPYRREAPPVEESRPTLLPRRKWWSVLIVVAIITAIYPVKGIAVMYAGRPRAGGLLLVVNLFAFALLASGEPLGLLLQGILWLVDLGAAGIFIREHNNVVAEQEARREALEEDEERLELEAGDHVDEDEDEDDDEEPA